MNGPFGFYMPFNSVYLIDPYVVSVKYRQRSLQQ